MAAPKVEEVVLKSRDSVLVFFDQPLDEDIAVPVTSFSLNYGKIPISAAGYYGTAGILLMLDREMSYRDKLELNYQPPEDPELALRSPVGPGASNAIIRRNVVRAFYKLPVKNLLGADEQAWMATSNLGGGKRFVPNTENPEIDSNMPGFDPCGDGSVIIGNPNNIINQRQQGEILQLKNLVGGTGYPDGYVRGQKVNVDQGSGRSAELALNVENGVVIGAAIDNGGFFYQVDDTLTLQNDLGVGFSVQVGAVYFFDYSGSDNDGAPIGELPPGTSTRAGDSNTGDSGGGTAGDGGGGTRFQDLPYPNIDRPSPRAATPDDFVLAYGLREAIQLSNIDDADASKPNNEKIWMAIEDACALIDNYITGATRAGRILISSSRRRTSLIIARYYLDTVRRREDVKKDYELAITELDKARTLQDVTRPEIPWWLDPCNPNRGNGVRSHRIPQYYNGVSGKGLGGWWVDSSSEERADYRVDGDNSQNNNDDGNGAPMSSAPREPEQPTDIGGSGAGGENDG